MYAVRVSMDFCSSGLLQRIFIHFQTEFEKHHTVSRISHVIWKHEQTNPLLQYLAQRFEHLPIWVMFYRANLVRPSDAL